MAELRSDVPPPAARVMAAAMEQEAGSLLRAARRLCRGDDDRAQDLVQDTFVRGYQACLSGRFRGGAAGPWLMCILRNLFINDYNHRRRRPAGVDVDTLTSGGEAGPASTHARAADLPHVALLAGVLSEEIEMALGSLAWPVRSCILLVDVEGLEYTEAAAALNIPVGTLRSRLSRGRSRLKCLLTGVDSVPSTKDRKNRQTRTKTAK